MKRQKFFAAVLILIFVLVSFWVTAEDYRTSPVAISPGSDTELVSIWQSCPTFSWSAIDHASSYRISVFEVIEPKVMGYESMSAMKSPVINKDIPGPALSWTLSSKESLKTGNMYSWYVQALDEYGNTMGNWSNGKIFKVEQEILFVGIEERLAKKMREYDVNEDTIANIIKDMKSEVNEVAIRDSSSKNNINNQGRSGIEGYEGTTNTFYGLTAGASITTGKYNSFFGREAGEFNNSGESNTFIGCVAGVYNTTGSKNTFVGSYSGVYNNTGYENTFLGYTAGYYNTTGYNNTFLGNSAGLSNTTGNCNTFLGNSAGLSNTTGNWNTFLGNMAGNNNTTGNQNIFFGYHAGISNTTGYENIFLGYKGGYFNTVGDKNIFIGVVAGYANTTGYQNTYIGYHSGVNNTTGYNNTFLGHFSGENNITGGSNIFLGYMSGYNETGSNKLYIDNSGDSFPLIYGEFDNNIIAINGKLGIGTKTPDYPMELETTGQNAAFTTKRTDGATNIMSATLSWAQFGSVTNHPVMIFVNNTWKMRLDTDGSLNMANGATCTSSGVWINASSRKLKENIKSLSSDEAVEVLTKLNPVKYNYKNDKTEKYVGFIAEDAPELVATKDKKGMSPMDVVAVLTKVVQEQQKTIAELKEKIASFEKK